MNHFEQLQISKKHDYFPILHTKTKQPHQSGPQGLSQPELLFATTLLPSPVKSIYDHAFRRPVIEISKNGVWVWDSETLRL